MCTTSIKSLLSARLPKALAMDTARYIQKCDFNDKNGLLIIIWTRGLNGADIDAKNMKKVASTLGFAVLEMTSPTLDQFINLVDDVKRFSFISEAPSCKVIIFYYSGHGGSDLDNLQPFVAPTEGESFYVHQMVSALDPKKAPGLKYLKRLFFFDMCQGKNEDSGSSESCESRGPARTARTPKLVYKVPAKGNCLVAFAGSIGYRVVGGDIGGGFWTRHLIKYLDKDMDIHVVLAKTWKDTVIFTSDYTRRNNLPRVQGPSFFSCMGPLNLTRKFC